MLRATLGVLALASLAVGCGTTLSAEQQATYDKLLVDRDNERAWIGMVGDERRQLRSKVGALEKRKGAQAGGAMTCGAWGRGALRLGTAPAGKGKGKGIQLAGGGSKTVAGGTCSSGSARLAP